MRGWFKRNDGFEWKKYVRTTVRLRRENRKQKLVAAKDAVASGLKEAGSRSVSASETAAQGLWGGLKSMPRAVWLILLIAVRAATRGLAVAARAIAATLRRIIDMAKPGFSALVGWLGARPVRLGAAVLAGIAATWGLSRYRAEGADLEVVVALWIAAAAAAVALVPILLPIVAPIARRASGWVASAGSRAGLSRRTMTGAGIAAGVVAVAAGGYAFVSGSGVPALPSVPKLSLLSAPEISGRAVAVSGDTLRLDGRLIGLAGIEAPDRGQSCTKGGNRRWRCGIAATEALAQRLKRQPVTCAPAGGEERGRQLARCRIGSEDLAGLLVREGHVFAAAGFFSSYASLETTARTQKAGLWAGDAERPQVWKSRLLDDAKKRAPNQCPVKGVKAASGLRYVMPWEDDYVRVRVRVERGERWFCSEDEARTAGYKLAS
ncbi:MAG: thermonuclease family protein [Hyphomicrobiaceae bacterium]|jgi:endonuclease YncB( thermonuclease family)